MAKSNNTSKKENVSANAVTQKNTQAYSVRTFTDDELKVLHKKVTIHNAILRELGDTSDKNGKKFKSIMFGADKDKNVYRKMNDEELKDSKSDENRIQDSGKSVFGYTLMLTESTKSLTVKFAGCRYAINDNGVDDNGNRMENDIRFLSGHGISQKQWNAKAKDAKKRTKADNDAIRYYDKADKILIDEYCFTTINVSKRVNAIASAVEYAVDTEKTRLIESIGIKAYNKAFNAIENGKDESEEEVA